MTRSPDDEGPAGRASGNTSGSIPESSSTGPLAQLVLEVLERLEAEGPEVLERACRENPGLADGLRRRMGALADLGLVEIGSGGQEPIGLDGSRRLERVGDFRLVEKVGSGGMGVVYRAEQISLGREVALKLIRPDSLHLDEARERFTRETAIVAKLSHPGIVPIHVVGGEEEVPYYAMEYVPGCTLAEALAVLAGQSPDGLKGADLWFAVSRATRRVSGATPREGANGPGALFAGSWEDTCLRVIGQVSEALEHAHARGVLHRDLKPSNVMITPGGRVMLMDFGLSQSEGADTMTRSAARIGSIPYMPPELLRDGAAVLDRRSDVYGLGVTLYEMLTLRLPFAGASVPALLARILEGRPPRPRAYHPGLSWEAETVCLAALDRDPERRYASAADLTRDLSNALQRLPVEARRASAVLRLRRWVERRPAEAVVALLLVVLPSVAAFLLSREARTVNAAYGVAEANRDMALRSIDAMLVRVSDQALDGVPGMLGLRGELLDEAADLYSELLEARPEDLEVALLAARCEHLRNRLLRDEGQYVEAEALARRALARLQPWPGSSGPGELRGLRADLLDDLHMALRLQQRNAEAVAVAGELVEALRSLADDDPDDVRARRGLLLAIASQLESMNFADEMGGTGGVDALRGCVEAMRELAREHPELDFDRALTDVLKTLAHGLSVAGEGEEAAEVLAEQRALLRQILTRDPSDEHVRFKLAQSASLQAGELIEADRADEALALVVIAEREIGRVRDDHPGLAEYDYLAGHVASNHATALAALGDHEGARLAAESGMEVIGMLHEQAPGNAEYARTLGILVLAVADAETHLGDGESALASCEFAEGLFEQALQARPNSEEWRKWIAITDYRRANALLALGRPCEAAQASLRCLERAGRRTDVARSGLARLRVCLEQAADTAADGTAAGPPCGTVLGEALRVADERGDLEGEAALEFLRALGAD